MAMIVGISNRTTNVASNRHKKTKKIHGCEGRCKYIFVNKGGQMEAQMKLHSKRAYRCWNALKVRIAMVLEKNDKKYKQKSNDTM